MIGLLLLDGVILVALGVMIGYAVVLNRRLRVLRDSRGEMDSVVDRLTDAVAHADRSLAGLREACDGSARHLQTRSEAGRALLDELNFVVERAESAAQRLESAIVAARPVEQGRRAANVVELDREQPKAARPAPRPAPQSAPQSAPAAEKPAARPADPSRPDWASLGRLADEAEEAAGLPLRGETRRSESRSAEPAPRKAVPAASTGRSAAARAPVSEEAPNSRGAALVRALRGMR